MAVCGSAINDDSVLVGACNEDGVIDDDDASCVGVDGVEA